MLKLHEITSIYLRPQKRKWVNTNYSHMVQCNTACQAKRGCEILQEIRHEQWNLVRFEGRSVSETYML